MNVTIPHFGETHLYAGLLFRELGIPFIAPPGNSRVTLERGTAVSPEELCLPFKLMAGNLMEAWEKGADTVLFPATMGPCRLGEYAELLKRILERNGYGYRWILLDSPTAIGYRALFRRLSLVLETGCFRELKAIQKIWSVQICMRYYEQIRTICRMAYGDADMTIRSRAEAMERDAGKTLEQAESLGKTVSSLKKLSCAARMMNTGRAVSQPEVRVLVTGEIYSCIEPFANHQIATVLRNLGVSFVIEPTIGWWVDRCRTPFLREKNKTGDCSEKQCGIPCEIGGYAKDTVKLVSGAERNGFDGVIHMFPTGCMPEIVSKSVFERGGESGIPILTLLFDEMAGEAGYLTRVEAFIDLLRRRKQGMGNRNRG